VGVKRPGFNLTEFRNEWRYNSVLPVGPHGMDKQKF